MKNNNKGFVGLLVPVIILLIAALVAGVVLVQQNQNIVNKAATPTDIPTPRQSEKPDPTPRGAADKLTICHVPPGNIANAQTLTISKNAWTTGHSIHNAHKYDFVMNPGDTCPAGTPRPSSTPNPTPAPTEAPTASPVATTEPTATPTASPVPID